MARVAVLGTGIMGGPMARNLLRSGHDVTVWNRTVERAEPLGAEGATVAATPVVATLEQFNRAFELGHGDEDMSAVYYASAASAGLRT